MGSPARSSFCAAFPAPSGCRRTPPLAEAAAAVGFSDQSHLTRHFRRITGVTPGHHRAAAPA